MYCTNILKRRRKYKNETLAQNLKRKRKILETKKYTCKSSVNIGLYFSCFSSLLSSYCPFYCLYVSLDYIHGNKSFKKTTQSWKVRNVRLRGIKIKSFRHSLIGPGGTVWWKRHQKISCFNPFNEIISPILTVLRNWYPGTYLGTGTSANRYSFAGSLISQTLCIFIVFIVFLKIWISTGNWSLRLRIS